MIVAAASIEKLANAAGALFTVKRFEHSLDLSSQASDIRLQLQTDPRYQDFIHKAAPMKVLGYEMRVAVLGDVLQGKIWAYTDEQRRLSKRHKDLADILRIIESFPDLKNLLPDSIKGVVSIELKLTGDFVKRIWSQSFQGYIHTNKEIV